METTIENSNEIAKLTVEGKFITLEVTRKHDGRSHVATYRIGSTAAYDGYNLIYFGTIVGIGAKTVTIQESHGSAVRHRLAFDRFVFWNRDPIEESRKRNSEWMD